MVIGGIDTYSTLVLHGDGTDGSTLIVDSSLYGKAVTTVGTVQIDTAQKVFGTGSILFDGNSDYITLADSLDWLLDAGNGSPFAIDFRVRFASIPTTNTQQVLYAQMTSDVTNYIKFYYVNISDTLEWRLQVVVASSITLDFYSISTLSADTWYHISLVRVDNSNAATGWRIFINGVSQALTLSAGAWNASLPNLAESAFIGAQNYAVARQYFNGWIDEFRISNGVSRWTSDFTPPTKAYDTSVYYARAIMISD